MTTPFGKKKGHRFNLSGVSVFIGMPTHRPLPPETVASLLATQEACWTRGIQFSLTIEKGSSIVEAARSKVAKAFLQSDCSHLFWIDSDMVWDADAFLRVLGLSTKNPIVGAAYRMKCAETKFMVGPPDEGCEEIRSNEVGCIPWSGMGLGFTCVSREVMQKLADASPKLIFPDIEGPTPHIFSNGTDDGVFMGEDMKFFRDCRALGYEVWIDPSISLGHVGDEIYSGSLKEQLDRMAASKPTPPLKPLDVGDRALVNSILGR